MRDKFSLPTDIHILGFTLEEEDRAERFVEQNPSLNCQFPLIEQKVTKGDCLGILERVGIDLPAMYRLGYEHNNCVGCVKGKMGYWNKIRVDFPDVFQRMAKLERTIGATINRKNGECIYLDELPTDAGRDQKEPNIECGVFCESASLNWSK